MDTTILGTPEFEICHPVIQHNYGKWSTSRCIPIKHWDVPQLCWKTRGYTPSTFHWISLKPAEIHQFESLEMQVQHLNHSQFTTCLILVDWDRWAGQIIVIHLGDCLWLTIHCSDVATWRCSDPDRWLSHIMPIVSYRPIYRCNL